MRYKNKIMKSLVGGDGSIQDKFNSFAEGKYSEGDGGKYDTSAQRSKLNEAAPATDTYTIGVCIKKFQIPKIGFASVYLEAVADVQLSARNLQRKSFGSRHCELTNYLSK